MFPTFRRHRFASWKRIFRLDIDDILRFSVILFSKVFPRFLIRKNMLNKFSRHVYCNRTVGLKKRSFQSISIRSILVPGGTSGTRFINGRRTRIHLRKARMNLVSTSENRFTTVRKYIFKKKSQIDIVFLYCICSVRPEKYAFL